MSIRLRPEFYQQDTIDVAQQLLGKVLVRKPQGGVRVFGEIVETEAYLGLEDPACHSFSGKITPRTSTLYLPAGHSYVYLVYGMHHCFNVVCGNTSQPEAVLIRALLLQDGLGLGPGKLCRALNIDRSHNGIDLVQSEEIFIEEPTSQLRQSVFEATPRIGIDYAGDAAHWPLRFRSVVGAFS